MIIPGVLCFAKVRGYFPWPARVNILPKDVKLPNGKIPVFFYGTHQVSYVSENDIYDFEKYKDVYGAYKEKNAKFNQGMEELQANPNVLQLGFDKSAVKFLSQFYKFDQKDAEALYSSTTEVTSNDKQDNTLRDNPRKRNHSSTIGHFRDKKRIKIDKLSNCIKADLCIELHKIETVIKFDELVATMGEQYKSEESVPPEKTGSQSIDHIIESEAVNEKIRIQSLDEKTDTQSIDEKTGSHSVDEKIDTPSTDDKTDTQSTDYKTDIEITLSQYSDLKPYLSETCKTNQLKIQTSNSTSFKSPIENIEISRPKRASAVRFKESLQSYKREMAQKLIIHDNVPKIKLSNKGSEDKIHRHTSTHHPKRNREQIPSVNRSHSICQHPVPAVINEEERNLRIVSQLSVIDKEIKRTLVVGNENYEMCMKLMKKLDDMKNINLVFLCKVPEIVTTMRKCRRYKKDDSIKSSASDIYQRFYQIYEKSDIDEKIEAGAELLKRDSGNCKSAQTLMDEIFVSDTKSQQCNGRQSIPSIAISSPSSAVSHQSSSANTPLLPTETESVSQFDPIIVNINKLLANGSMKLIETYDAEKGFIYPFAVDADNGKPEFDDRVDLYEKLGV